MASKRNSRAYKAEEGCRPDSQQQLPTYTSYRSRRSSRSSTKEESIPSSKDSDESQSNAISIRETTAVARSQNTVTIAKEISITGTTRSGDSAPISSNMSVSSMASISTTSTELSAAPLNGRPLNFGAVIPGVYRSSYPKAGDFEYIKGLKLKTLVTLVKKDEIDQDLQTFVTSNGIRQIVFNMKGTKKEAIPLATMKSILDIILNRQNHPLLIHCNHGKHRTGCVVGVVRKISGWDTQSVVDEYRSFAEPKIRECDVEYLRAFQVSTLRESGDHLSGHNPAQTKTFRRALVFSIFIMALWLFSGSQMTTAAATRSDRLLR